MSDKSEGSPPWLFSFVDLAFLMVIAMTQVASDVGDDAPDLGEMVVPRISSESIGEMPTAASEAWQLRVHPRGDEAVAPFELVLIGTTAAGQSEHYGSIEPLRERLAELESANRQRPLLAPHQDSRSQDLLDAAALIEEFWPGRRRVTVARLFEM
jgi:hypothetical protein